MAHPPCAQTTPAESHVVDVHPPSRASDEGIQQVASKGDPGDDAAAGPCPNDLYTVFTARQKQVIVFMISFAGFFSPFTAFIYFPALDVIARDLHLTVQLMNVTITTYMVIQAVVPLLLGNLADVLGRRPVYFLAFVVYLCASIGLIYTNSYPALLVLRMLQSAGSSGTILLAYAVVSDIAPPRERGGYVGMMHIGMNSAPSLGPVIGGVLSDRVHWRWIFRFLSLLSGICLMVLVIFLPETERKIVGNGSVPPTGLNKALILNIFPINDKEGDDNSSPRKNRSWAELMNPFRSFRLIFHRGESLVLFSNSIFYMAYSCIQASLSVLFIETYGLNELQAGLAYLAFGITAAFSSYVVGMNSEPIAHLVDTLTGGQGMISDRDYRITASSHGSGSPSNTGDHDPSSFALEKARLRTVFAYVVLSSSAIMGYGWGLQKHTHIAVPLVLQVLLGFCITGIFNVLNTLIVDLHPEAPASASASVSITRCSVAAAGVAVMEISFDRLGAGWTFTIIGALCFGTIPLLVLERINGMKWRTARRTKAECQD